EMRHAVLEQRLDEGADSPARMGEAVPGEPWARPQRGGKSGTYVVLPVRSNRCVDCEHQDLVARTLHALDQRLNLRHIARQIRLKPGARVFFYNFFESNERRAAHDHWDVFLRCGSRKHNVAPISGHRHKPHRGDSEWARVSVPEQAGRLRAFGDVDQEARQKSEFRKSGAITLHRTVILNTSRDKSEDRARKASPRQLFEILE